jgi:hypothetical protein
MKKIKVRSHCLIVALVVLAGINHLAAQGTAFTYQGLLNNGANPANGGYDLTFSLFNEGTGGSQVGGTVTNLDVGVTNGLFTVTVDFGAVFTAADYWLQIGVRTNGGSAFTALSPRQQLMPVPFSIIAENVTGAIPLAQLPAAVLTNDESGVTLDNVTVDGDLTLASPATIYSGGTNVLRADGSGNFFAGPSAGNLTLTGEENTGVGAKALAMLTSGLCNQASGWAALYLNTNGSFNTANGVEALGNNTSGSYNTANGIAALYLNETGSYNIALGNYAGYNIITGNYNIDIGNMGAPTDTNIIRIGSGQTQTFIAGVINGNGGGLTGLNASQVTSGTIPLAQLPAIVASLSEPGAGNFFAGPSAGNSGVGGALNTGVGDSALYTDTTGSWNTAEGASALENNTIGSYDAAFGIYALFDNSTGSNNTATGSMALMYNTTANDNTGTGAYALSAYSVPGFLTAGGNTADGAYALYSDESGYNNTAAGFQALYSDTNGFDNVGIGVDALQVNVSGYQNTGVGTYAFQHMTGGNGNIGIGCGAGINLISGNNNIYIGNGGLSGDNGVIRIGSSQTKTIIAGTSVGINTGSPTEALEVNGDFVLIDGAAAGDGAGAIDAYIGGNGSGSDVQIGSMNSGIANVAFWNWGNSTYMHVYCSSITINGGSDLAEPFEVSSPSGEIPQGSVVVIDEENPGHHKVSSQAYDTRVAGVLSGANGIKPGIQMLQQGLLEGGKNVALTGRVYVLADASNGPIKPGDLLTTSSMPGHAMKVSDHARAQGAILGKAMTSLKEGQGMVLVLVTLQ